jgi:hypothetical protein
MDLSALLQTKSSEHRPKPNTNGFTPSAPIGTRAKRSALDFHSSSLAVLPKYKFDLKSLISHAETDEATEASSKRVKAMIASKEDESIMVPRDDGVDGAKFVHGNLLESVVVDKEDGELQKVTRALMRTEAIITEKRWYFFDTQSKSTKPKRQPFPTASVPQNWKGDLVDPQLRHHTFVSGFAEDMVSYGRTLPDELFLWILNEVCFESQDVLRNSYCNILKESSEQVHRLIVPDLIRKTLQALGGSSVAVNVTQKIIPAPALTNPYTTQDLAKLRSVVKLFGQFAKSLQQKSRTYIISMLQRMSVDHVVFENVDLLDSVQETIYRLCRYTPEDKWEISVSQPFPTRTSLTLSQCQEICNTVFNSVEQPSLRLKVVESISSISPSSHDLRKRLAMCFYFNALSYSTSHSHHTIDLDRFIKRLDDSDFYTTPQTDYRELSALISLLDIAVDDARSTKLNMMDEETDKRFNEDIETLGAIIKDIMRSIGNPGAAFISRIEAKEVLELVSHRIVNTLRSKPKPKETLFDAKHGKIEEDHEGEKKHMQKFLLKVKSVENNVDKQVQS